MARVHRKWNSCSVETMVAMVRVAVVWRRTAIFIKLISPFLIASIWWSCQATERGSVLVRDLVAFCRVGKLVLPSTFRTQRTWFSAEKPKAFAFLVQFLKLWICVGWPAAVLPQKMVCCENLCSFIYRQHGCDFWQKWIPCDRKSLTQRGSSFTTLTTLPFQVQRLGSTWQLCR